MDLKGKDMKVVVAMDSFKGCLSSAAPTHNHPEGIKGAVATALAVFYLKNGKDKEYIREHVLNKYYPDWMVNVNEKFDEVCNL